MSPIFSGFADIISVVRVFLSEPSKSPSLKTRGTNSTRHVLHSSTELPVTKATDHPSREALQAYCRGQLPEERAAMIDQHLLDCDTCCDTVTKLSSGDSFVGLLHSVQGAPAGDLGGASHDSEVSTSGIERLPPSLLEHRRYEIVGLVGEGGMGRVYRARHRVMDRDVALKVIHQKWMTHQPSGATGWQNPSPVQAGLCWPMADKWSSHRLCPRYRPGLPQTWRAAANQMQVAEARMTGCSDAGTPCPAHQS